MLFRSDDIANASTADIAAALKDAVDKEEGTSGTGKYTVTNQGNKVTITSTDKRSDVEAIKVDFPYGDEKTTAKFQFDPKAVSEGATLKFGGNTYEFVGADGKTTTDGAIALRSATTRTPPLRSWAMPLPLWSRAAWLMWLLTAQSPCPLCPVKTEPSPPPLLPSPTI